MTGAAQEVGLAAQHGPAVASGPIEEAWCRAEELRSTRAEAPVVVLGVFERVGSNWFVDSLRPRGVVHNEPFRQQLHPTHPLSVLNPHQVGLRDLAGRDWRPYEWHWLVSFVVSKYGTPSHVVKETNLFFAVGNLLGLFPDAPVVVLSRSPAGIASSFARASLFTRWGYRDRYGVLAAAVTRPELAAFRCVLPDDRPDELRMLSRMIVLNALALADAVGVRRFVHVPYEQAVVDQAAALQDAVQVLGHRRFALARDVEPTAARSSALDDTYNTRQVGTRTLHLNADDVARIRHDVDDGLAAASRELPVTTVETARGWLSVDPAPPSPRVRRPDVEARTARSEPTLKPSPGSVEAGYLRDQTGQALLWRTTLVTNGEFCAFLNDMRQAAMHNVVGGTLVFCNDAMPHERGGRIHPDPNGGGHGISPGYETHPVYWVTWLGTAAFARWAGARLPTRREIDRWAVRAEVDLDAINADYRIGDVTPAADDDGPVGNLQVWCADGPPVQDLGGAPLTRFLYGAAWNTPATWTEIRRLRSRHITGSSRGVGIRLVKDIHPSRRPEPASAIAEDLSRAIEQLAHRDRSLAALDAELVRAATGRASGSWRG